LATPRQHEAVVVGRVGVGHGLLGGEPLALVEVVERLDLTGLGSEELDLRPGLLDGLERLGELDLLDAFVGHQERDALALQFF